MYLILVKLLYLCFNVLIIQQTDIETNVGSGTGTIMRQKCRWGTIYFFGQFMVFNLVHCVENFICFPYVPFELFIFLNQ